jgi:hypothetical protein
LEFAIPDRQLPGDRVDGRRQAGQPIHIGLKKNRFTNAKFVHRITHQRCSRLTRSQRNMFRRDETIQCVKAFGVMRCMIGLALILQMAVTSATTLQVVKAQADDDEQALKWILEALMAVAGEL